MQGTQSCAYQGPQPTEQQDRPWSSTLLPQSSAQKKIQDEKDNKKASTPVDANGQWEDFFEAALIDGLEDEREQEQEEQVRENGSVASSDDDDDSVV
jgi:hypothetical protein